MTTTTDNHTRRNGWWTALALTAVLAGATACGESTPEAADAGTSATPTSTAPAPLPTQDWNRPACHTLPTDMLETLDNLGDTRRAAEYAAKSDDALMHRHGEKLLTAVTDRETADLNGDQNAAVDANLDISKAALDMAEACATLYGDGPW